MKECGRLIKKYRTKKNLTQYELSRKLRYETGQAISGIERGVQRIPPEKLSAISFYLGIPKSHLMAALKRDLKERYEGQYEV